MGLIRSKQDDPQWVFKGLKKAKWPLKTTLERAFEQFDVRVKNETFKDKKDEEKKVKERKIEIERAMIREFQRRYHHYTANVPDKCKLDEWMALMQHHGAPTRLLDFTYSPYVAAYFAFEDACCDSKVAIWAVNTKWCKNKLKNRVLLYQHYLSYQQHRKPKNFNAIFMSDHPHKLVLGVNPYRLNERLASQKATFLCPGDSAVSFMDNLPEGIGNHNLYGKIIQFIIPTGKSGEKRDEALFNLEYMNINRITLFPGLDGFAQSFEPRIPWFRSIEWGQFRFGS